jgi:hypothetical protein
MRDCTREHVNGGFYIIKKNYFETYKSFVRKMLSHGISDYYYGDQGYINENRDELDWDFIPDEYIIDKLNGSTYDLDRVCIHHAIASGKTLMDKLSCMHKVKSMIHGKTPDHLKIRGDYELVVAKYKENISWTKRYANVKVYDKGPRGNTPNIGREAHTYLSYIIQNYERLPGTVYFSRGNIAENGYTEEQFTTPIFRQNMIHDNVPSYRTDVVYPVSKLNIIDWFHTYVDKDINLDDAPINIWRNAIFSVKRNRILSRTKEYYQMLLDMIPKTNNPGVCDFFERSWYYIFNMHKTETAYFELETLTGLGDRFFIIFLAMTICPTQTFYMKWPEKSYYKYDISLLNIENGEIIHETKTDADQIIKLDLKYPTFVPKDINTFRNMAKRIRMSEKVLSRIPTCEYVVIHVRATDKIVKRQEVPYWEMTSEMFEDIKLKCIDYINNHKEYTYLVCTDDSTIRKEFEDIIPDDKKISLDYSDDIDASILDLFVMSKAKKIIQCTRYSNFSMVASLIGEVPIVNFDIDNLIFKDVIYK